MGYLAVVAAVGLCLVFIFSSMWLRAAVRAAAERLEQLGARSDSLANRLNDEFSAATADMAARLERAKGDLRQEMADRMAAGFDAVRDSLHDHLSKGRYEQAHSLDSAFTKLEQRFQALQDTTDRRLMTVTERVQEKLDENIKQGFAQFEKVQFHLKAAEERLKDVGSLGSSISDLNNLLKMPHLRGRFGEVSLERLLADFLPAHMYEIQSCPGDEGQGRADAVIKFPGRRLPIDAKFPREQILPLFESSDPDELAHARERFGEVMKEQGRRIAAYIQPDNGTTDMALMYLPSETLYMETVLNAQLGEWLNKHRVFAVSPNTLIVTLQAIAMVFKMYEFAKSYEAATEELRKAQQSFSYFEEKFESVGKSLGKAQEAYDVALGHLSKYRNRVTRLAADSEPQVESVVNGEAQHPRTQDS